MTSLTVRAELHCHNIHSNFHVGDDEPPYDSGVTIYGQLERARQLGLDAVFVTNHNTLSGYKEMLKYSNDHEKYRHIMVYPAEEVTIDSGAHVLAYGIHTEIPAGLPLFEVLDEIRRQNGISSAPHPFSLLDALRGDAIHCDIIETFNSNNVDVISNACAAEFAATNSMTAVAGSDSHILSTMGRCVNAVSSQNTLDDVLQSIRHGHVGIERSGYALNTETLEHLQYKIQSSRVYLEDYISEHYPHMSWLLNLLLRAYNSRPDSSLWLAFYRLGVYLMGRISHKINEDGMDPGFMKDRNLATMLRMAL